jgi:hypothetical protein
LGVFRIEFRVPAGSPSDGSIGGELMRLSDLVKCERGTKDALKAWADHMPQPAAPK